MTTDTTVKYFDSTMSGAPSLSGVAGTLIDVLDACLVNGFGSVTLDSLVVASNVATATVSGGHNFPLVGATGMVVRIEGATPAGLNGDWRIQSATTTQFTFATTGIADQTATGTISAKRAPAGFSKVFSGTNLAVYRSTSVQGNGAFFRLDDTLGKVAKMNMYEAMTDISTGTNPTTDGYINKYQTTGIWKLVANDHFVYLITETSGTNTDYIGGYYWGEMIRTDSTDIYASVVALDATNRAASATFNDTCSAHSYINSATTSAAKKVLRETYQTLQGFAYEMTVKTIGGAGIAGYEYVNGSLLSAPLYIGDSKRVRGRLPGALCPLHALNPPAGVYSIDGDDYICCVVGGISGDNGRILYNISGAWT